MEMIRGGDAWQESAVKAVIRLVRREKRSIIHIMANYTIIRAKSGIEVIRAGL